MTAETKDFLDDIAGYVKDPGAGGNRLGTIDSGYTSGRPRVLFDGESVLGAKVYPFLAAYVPRAGDRVLLAPMGSSYVVLGSPDIVATASLSYVNAAASGIQNPVVRQGGFASVSFRVTTTAAIPQLQPIATLPTGFRPNPAGGNLHFGGSMLSGGVWSTMTYYINVADGTIRVLLPSGAPSGADLAASIPPFLAVA